MNITLAKTKPVRNPILSNALVCSGLPNTLRRSRVTSHGASCTLYRVKGEVSMTNPFQFDVAC